jgi:hypothetical protein
MVTPEAYPKIEVAALQDIPVSITITYLHGPPSLLPFAFATSKTLDSRGQVLLGVKALWPPAI